MLGAIGLAGLFVILTVRKRAIKALAIDKTQCVDSFRAMLEVTNTGDVAATFDIYFGARAPDETAYWSEQWLGESFEVGETKIFPPGADPANPNTWASKHIDTLWPTGLWDACGYVYHEGAKIAEHILTDAWNVKAPEITAVITTRAD